MDLGPRCPVLGFPGELLEVDLDRRGNLDRKFRNGGGLDSSSIQYGGHQLSLTLVGGTLLLLHHYLGDMLLLLHPLNHLEHQGGHVA